MTTHEINLLIERYLDGETTLAEERELALAVQREDRPAEWAIIAEMLGELTADEAMWTLPQPLPKGRGEVTTSINGFSENVVSAPLHSDFCPSITRGARGEWGRGWVRWAAAACIAVALGLSYYIIKEEPQEMAKADQPQHVQPQTESMPIPIAREEPPSPELQHQQMPTRQPIARQNVAIQQSERPLAEEQVPTDESLHELEAQSAIDLLVVAEVQEPTPPSEDLALCMALLAEVEARAVMLQQTQQTHPLTPPYNGGEWSLTPINGNSDNVVSTSSLSGRDGVGLLLLDELLANIQQQSNRPELSL